MRVAAYVRFYLKDVPSNYLGLRQESWTFGKESKLSLAGLAILFLETLFNFYLATVCNEDEVRKAVSQVQTWLKGVTIVSAKQKGENHG